VSGRERTMITFSAGSWRFNYRVGAVVVRDDHVLLMRMGSNDFWFVPGGRIEAGEPAKLALEREVTEELGVACQIERLLWTSENFFRTNETLYHEVALYFAVTLPGDAHRDRSVRITGTDGGTPYECVWHAVGSLDRIRLVPGFLARSLMHLPDMPQHVVEVEPSAAPYMT
jgi:ADP-ribose pyrophosphatase YjhB (NUDIX family)